MKTIILSIETPYTSSSNGQDTVELEFEDDATDQEIEEEAHEYFCERYFYYWKEKRQ